MKKVIVKFGSIVQVQNFVNEMERFSSDVALVSGTRTADAKSIIGVFSLNIYDPLILEAKGKDENAVIEAVKHITVE